MSARNQRRRASRRGVPYGFTSSLGLESASNVYRAVDRRMPEAGALAKWLLENAAALGLPESAVPDDDSLDRSRRRGVSVTDWEKVGTALERAASGLPAESQGTIDCWGDALERRLALDALERRILALALHYRLDQRVEGLCDAISECRGRPTRSGRVCG